MDKCPYLGLPNDPKTAVGFASEGNFCYHAKPIAPVNQEHQEAFCLTKEHKSCPVFLHSEIGPLPKGIISSHKQLPGMKVVYGAALLVILAVVVTAVATLGRGAGMKDPITVQSVQPSVAVVTGIVISPTSVSTKVWETVTVTPAPLKCDPPEGWVLYIIKPTDSIFRLSLVFGVGVADLQSANCMGTETILQPGDGIYVPPPSLTTPTTPILAAGSPTPTNTPQIQLTSIPRPIPSITPKPTKVSPPGPTSVPPPTKTSAPIDTPPPVNPTSTPVPPQPTAKPTNTPKALPPTPTSPPPPTPLN